MQCDSDEEWTQPFLDEEDPLPNQICPYATSSEISIKSMLEISSIDSDDVVLDLGCGDGRIVIYAAKHYGIRGIGLDINPELIKSANENAKKEGVDHLVLFKVQDFANESFDFKLSSIGLYNNNNNNDNNNKLIYPTILTCYLIPRALKVIESKVKKLIRDNDSESTNHKSIRIATIVYPFERWQHINDDNSLKIFLYTKDSIDIIPKSLDSSNPIFI
ncbi:hypothetical protein DDB_G0280421 [Dictyostelium discoideum AX4]|uniref:Methyltransferase domain-containing protein n=1 Tax=Dictyostelium discoideum TaxID=44689 RepID=Q54VE3_DICDI|nr:hypothetical protein DDB_G0280421 [Dictyostelium discoideum AX4]EAL67189.1 hypothetical protein DDB_G0280421 [Dictyostelium discoideum AX4]|eukprot:XP_641166.1 hypothetical protein DDB_G0280421 [Dictyostelium discoideum AX4]